MSLCVLQVWISYAQFELSIDSSDRLERCRQIFEEANKGLRSCEEKEERLMLLESWKEFEKEFGSDSTRERVSKLLPEKVKKRRKLIAEDGVSIGLWLMSMLRWGGEGNLPLFFFLYSLVTMNVL